MEKYDYKRAITDDVKDWIVNETDILEEGITEGKDDDIYNWLYDEIFDEDSITGNGAYYYSTEEKCSEFLSGNYDLVYEAMNEYSDMRSINILISHFEDKDLARYFDCTIRCYLLMDCIYAAFEELEKEGRIKHYTDWNPDI